VSAKGTAPGSRLTFEDFEAELERLYAEYTPERAEAESGVPAAAVTRSALTTSQNALIHASGCGSIHAVPITASNS
jgi:anaerobic selenocysteine-containing dehydrogenase